jgi:hypothetical protein
MLAKFTRSLGTYIFPEELSCVSEEAICENQPDISQKITSKSNTLEQNNVPRGSSKK